MNNNDEDFHIKYWGQDFQSYKNLSDQKRSIRKKLFIVFGFISVLALIPILAFGLSNLEFIQENKISSVNQIKSTLTPSPIKKPLEKDLKKTSVETVLNNDSYWKISKRHCGTGKFYLSIRDQNDGKPLYKGDFVEASCSL